jgi:D-serine dehydratase
MPKFFLGRLLDKLIIGWYSIFMQVTYNQLRSFPQGTRLMLQGHSCDSTYTVLGIANTGNVIARELGQTLTLEYQPEFFTGNRWTILDADGYIVPSNGMETYCN